MATSPNSQPPRFEIDPSVVFKLGEELISDEIQALVELIKNSYDAGASKVFVTISTDCIAAPGSSVQDPSGYIIVEDDGSGMTLQRIKDGWLYIASSYKRKLKEDGNIGKSERTPLGDKGLGRLGVQRLGENVEIITRSASEPSVERAISFDWGAFRNAKRLHDVKVDIQDRPWSKKKPGTKIIISNLKTLDRWDNNKTKVDLQNDLASMISPYTEVKGMKLIIYVNGDKIDLAEIAGKIRNSAEVKYSFNFSNECFAVRALVRIEFLRPPTLETGLFEEFCLLDNGDAFFNYLMERKSVSRRPPIFRRSDDEGWYIEFGRDFYMLDIPGLKTDMVGKSVDPGPFFGEVDVVPMNIKKSSAMDSISAYKAIAKKLAGVRLYRDGFGIKMAVPDWLGLGAAQTSGPSFYGLRPNSVIGFVMLSARDNNKLKETTNREGLVVGPHYQNFYALLSEFVRFANNTQTFLRRGVTDFINAKKEERVDVASTDPVEAAGVKFDEAREELEKQKADLQTQREALRTRSKRKKSKVDTKSTGNKENTDDIDFYINKFDETIESVEKAIAQIGNQQTLREVLVARAEALQEEIGGLYEFVSLGITAEVVAHEVNHIAEDLSSRAQSLTKYISNQTERDPKVWDFTEHVRTSASALRKQLTFLAPSLRYVRENKEKFGINSFLDNLREHYKNRLSRRKIQIDLKIKKDFVININKGKMNQIFENLILNCEYWVNEAITQRHISKGQIFIEIDRPFVRVFDNGRGVDLAVENSLQEPFITTKPPGEGRGLGLFVVQQLLDSEGCQIYLLQKRNAIGRRYCFQMDLSGVIHD